MGLPIPNLEGDFPPQAVPTSPPILPLYIFQHSSKDHMTYITERNDRRRRRTAGLLTALIAFTLFAVFAYYGGLLDQFLLDYMSSPSGPVATAPVAAVGA